MAITNALNPQVVRTELDAIFVQEYEYPVGPGMATAATPEIFNQVSMDNSAHIEDVMGGGGGFWPTKGEQQPVNSASPRFGNKISYIASTYANSLAISKEFFDDNMHAAYSSLVKKFAMNARATRDKNAFALYRGAFTTTLTSDGQPFISATHVTLTGLTVDNLIVGALTNTTLNTGITRLVEQISEDGVAMGMEPAYLLVAPANYVNALQIVGSTLISNSPNNAINVFSSTYGIQVFRSPYLAASQGGSDTAWFLLSRNHGVTRYIREEVNTELVDYIYSNNDEYVYKGRFREVYGVTNYVGAVGAL